MAEETSLVAQQIRLSQWAAQIRDCQNRPEGMNVTTWCAQPPFVELQQPEENRQSHIQSK